MRARLRTILIASGVVVAVAAAGAWALINTGESSHAAAAFATPPPTTPTASPTASPTKSQRPKQTPTAGATSDSKPDKPRYRVIDSGSCEASYYWEPQDTAGGERFNPNALTAAHKSLPLNSRVRVTNEHNGKSVTVRINDRGPYVGGRCLDLSRAAMAEVGGIGSGVIPVKYQVLARS